MGRRDSLIVMRLIVVLHCDCSLDASLVHCVVACLLVSPRLSGPQGLLEKLVKLVKFVKLVKPWYFPLIAAWSSASW